MARLKRRTAVAAWLSGLIAAAVLTTTATAQEKLPQRLSLADWWALSVALSEPSASFISDNLVSNEMSFAQVIPEIKSWGVKNGVYLGVGPEQNFTYLEAMQARIGFVVDIRRENLLLHLMYKALFDVSPNRASFVANLFGRPGAANAGTRVDARELMDALAEAPKGSEAQRDKLIQLVARTLVGYGISLTVEDLGTIRGIQSALHEYGPDITYATTLLKRPIGPASFAGLMRQVDVNGRALGFLASEGAYRFVRAMQQKNLIIPVVGNFAGPKTIRGIGRYLRERRATVSAFYVSNVEDYLGRERSIPQNGEWRVFCENVAALPVDRQSVFIRPLGLAVFASKGGWRLSKDMLVASAADEARPSDFDGILPQSLSTIQSEIRECNRVRDQT